MLSWNKVLKTPIDGVSAFKPKRICRTSDPNLLGWEQRNTCCFTGQAYFLDSTRSEVPNPWAMACSKLDHRRDGQAGKQSSFAMSRGHLRSHTSRGHTSRGCLWKGRECCPLLKWSNVNTHMPATHVPPRLKPERLGTAALNGIVSKTGPKACLPYWI